MSDQNLTSKLIDQMNALLLPLGYEVVHLELVLSRQKALRLFIDFAEGSVAKQGDGEKKAVGIEDCVRVTHALEEPLDRMPEFEKIFPGGYELEVSSPGVDRPLRTARDFERFKGNDVRVHVFRPLTADEMGNAAYQARNPKQKNFIGTLLGFKDNRVVLSLSLDGTAKAGTTNQTAKKGKKGSNKSKAPEAELNNEAETKTNKMNQVSIPLPLISKANIEPKFEFHDTESENEL